MRLSWEQTRSMMYMVYVSIPAKSKKKSIQNFHPFEWDTNNKITVNNKEKVSEKDKSEVLKLLNK